MADMSRAEATVLIASSILMAAEIIRDGQKYSVVEGARDSVVQLSDMAGRVLAVAEKLSDSGEYER